MNSQKRIFEEIQKINRVTGVLSTVNGQGSPQAASLYFVHDENLNIYFITRTKSRKYKNIEKNPHVAFVITSESPSATIQLEGTVSKVTSATEKINYFSKLVTKASESVSIPPVSQMIDGEMAFMKMSMTWARVGNFEITREGDTFTEVVLEKN